MATRGDYRCRDCGREFEATVGPTRCAEEYRCDRCDRIKYVPLGPFSTMDLMRLLSGEKTEVPKPKAPGRCICGGEFKTGLFPPMCPSCGSRNTEGTRIVAFLD